MATHPIPSTASPDPTPVARPLGLAVAGSALAATILGGAVSTAEARQAELAPRIGTADARADAPAAPAAPRAAVDSFYRRWTDLVEGRDSLSEETFSDRAASLLETTFALDSLAAGALPGRWSELRASQRADFANALRASLRSKLVAGFSEGAASGYPALELNGSETDGGTAVLTYTLRSDGAERELTVHLRQGGDGGWRIHDAEYRGTRLQKHYRKRARTLVDEYSFRYMVAVVGDRRVLVVDDFEDDTVGQLPVAWHWRDRDDDKHKPYEVRREDGNQYLAARDEGESVSLGKDMKWNINEYPYASFRVRVHEIPEGADERYDETVDSAAGVYFVYERKLFSLVPRTVKYVWSSTLPIGAATQRDGVGKPWQVVVGSGRDGLGEWHTYVFDLREAYRDTFGGDPPDKPIGVGLLSDANAVGGKAYADYDDIVLLRSVEGDPGSGVDEILEP